MDVKVAHNNCKTFVQLSLCSPADDLNESLARDISELSISEKKQNCNNADNYELENGYLHRLPEEQSENCLSTGILNTSRETATSRGVQPKKKSRVDQEFIPEKTDLILESDVCLPSPPFSFDFYNPAPAVIETEMFKRNQINPILSLNYGDNSPSTRGKRPHVNAVRQNGPIFSNCIPLTNFINGTHSNAPTECDELSKGTYFLDATSSSHLYNSNSLSHQIPFTLLPDYTNKFEQDNSIHSPNILSNMCIPNNQFFSQMFSERNDEINSPLLHPFNEDKYANSMHCLPEQTMIHLPLLSGDDVEETFTNLLSKNPLCESSNSVSSLEKCDTLGSNPIKSENYTSNKATVSSASLSSEEAAVLLVRSSTVQNLVRSSTVQTPNIFISEFTCNGTNNNISSNTESFQKVGIDAFSASSTITNVATPVAPISLTIVTSECTSINNETSFYSTEQLLFENEENGNTLLHEAVRSQNIELVQKILESSNICGITKRVINKKNGLNQTAAFIAVCQNNVSILKLLLAHDADINIPSIQRASLSYPLHYAAERGIAWCSVLRAIVSAQHTCIEAKNHKRQTALHVAVEAHGKPLIPIDAFIDSRDTITILHQFKLKFTEKDGNDKTPLHYAVEKKNYDLLYYILDGMSPESISEAINLKMSNGATCLHLAAGLVESDEFTADEHCRIVQLLLDKGADWKARLGTQMKSSPSHHASNPRIEQLIIKFGKAAQATRHVR